MANLTVRNVDDAIVQALKRRASEKGISAEAEHRNILREILTQPQRKSFIEVLQMMPDVDFERVQDDSAAPVFE